MPAKLEIASSMEEVNQGEKVIPIHYISLNYQLLRSIFDPAYIAVAIRPNSYVHRVTSEVAVSFLPEVVAQI